MENNIAFKGSLNYTVWISHSLSIFAAAKANYQVFNSILHKFSTEAGKIQNGLFLSTGLLFAVSVELMIKARILFIKYPEISAGEITDLKEITSEWPPNKHDVLRLINTYKIEIPIDELKLIAEIKKFMIWAGRFPFPFSKEGVDMFDSGNQEISFPQLIDERVEKLLKKQLSEMEYTDSYEMAAFKSHLNCSTIIN